MFLGAVFYIVFTVTILLLFAEKKYIELFLGFFFILILSDNISPEFFVYKNVRELYLLILLTVLVFNKTVFQPFCTHHWLFVPFVFISFILALYNPDILGSMLKSLSYILLIFTVPQYVKYSLRNRSGIFLKSIFLICGTIVLMSVIGIFLFPNIVYSRGVEGRLNGLMGNPNGLGAFCTLYLMLFAMVSSYYKDLFTRGYKIFTVGSIFLTLILCGSRTAISGSILFGILWSMLKTRNFNYIINSIVMVIIFTIVSINITDIIVKLDLQDYFRTESLENASGRSDAWAFAVDELKKDYILGKGLGYTNFVFEQNQEALNKLGHQGSVHNTYLATWLDTGIFGLFYFLMAWFAYFSRAAKRTYEIYAVMFVVLFVNIFESWLTGSLNAFTIILVILLSTFSTVNTNIPQAQPKR